MRHPLIGCVTELAQFEEVINMYKRVYSNKKAYHINKKYLTRNDREGYGDWAFDEQLEILGTFISILYPKNSLAKSPLLNVGKAKRYADFPGYDADFAATCAAYKAEAMKGSNIDETAFFARIGDEVSGKIASNMENLLSRLRSDIKLLGVNVENETRGTGEENGGN
ncbi:hypothetical protein COBT_002375 [Conglomerata obtusa]